MAIFINMGRSKLLLLYASLSQNERDQLLKLLESPFFNQRKDVVLLAKWLNQHAEVGFEGLQPAAVFENVYPGEPFQPKKYRYLLSFLLKLTENFLIQRALEADPLRKELYLLQSFQERSLTKLRQEKLVALKKHLASGKAQDADHYFRFQAQQFEYNTLQSREMVSASLQNVSNEFDVYFIITKLKQACSILNHQKVLQTDFNIKFIDQVLDFIHEEGLLNLPIVAGYYAIYQMLMVPESETETHFNTILWLMETPDSELPQNELRSIYLLVLNYCIRQINTGDKNYLARTLDLYKVGLRSKALYQGELLSPWTFNNVVSIALKVDAVEWTESFIMDYSKDLPTSFQDRIPKYNIAELELKRGNPSKAIKILHQIQVSDSFTQLLVRISIIKAYYEMEELTSMSYALENLTQLIRRKTTLTYHKTLTKNFIKFTKKISNLPPDDSRRKLKISTEIKQTEVVAQKDWLLKICE